ncbi:unnamed protein product [Closterium sp. Yama58-4]|nr:unnamed protein product [Closterium sp. Yama58-4]
MLQSVKKTLVGGRKKQGKADASHDAGNAAAAAAPAGAARAGSGKGAGAANGGKAVPGQTPAGAQPAPADAVDGAAHLRDPSEVIAPADASPFAEPLPSLRDVAAAEKQALFIRKVQLCAHVVDFSDPMAHVREKEVKRQALLEVVDAVNAGTGRFTDAAFTSLTRMLEANLFRPLPPSAHEMAGAESLEAEEEEATMEAAWPHLQMVYEVLLRYVVSQDTDAKVAKRYIDQRFILRLLALFDSQDPRERDYVKTIVHRIYGKFMVHRPFIRRAIKAIFFRFIYEDQRHRGVAELLEILGSIINGFALPLKDEHKLFLVRALIPLHKPSCVAMYHQQLAYCVTQFVEKDPRLADVVVRGLLRFWPVTNSGKEVLFLGELEEVLELTQPPEGDFRASNREMLLAHKGMPRLLCLQHRLCHWVAERALFLWNNDYIVTLVAQHRAAILPLVFPALERNARTHWNQAVNGLTINVRKMFLEMDQQLYDDCQRHFLEDEARAADVEELRAATWQRLEEAAAARSSGAGSGGREGEGQEGEGQGGMDVDGRGRAATNGAIPGL